jgi:tetratricopeptide (TPR) repeat protein
MLKPLTPQPVLFNYAPDPTFSDPYLEFPTILKHKIVLITLTIVPSLYQLIIFSIMVFAPFLVISTTLKNTALHSSSVATQPYTNSQTQIQQDKINHFNQLSLTTKDAWERGETTQSLTHAQDLLLEAETNEQRAIANYWIGLSYFSQNKSDLAETHLLQAVTFDQTYGPPYSTLAAISMGRANYPQALIYAQTCVKLEPTYPWCHNNLGLTLDLLGRHEEGIKELKQAVALDPQNYSFASNLKRMQAAP